MSTGPQISCIEYFYKSLDSTVAELNFDVVNFMNVVFLEFFYGIFYSNQYPVMYIFSGTICYY